MKYFIKAVTKAASYTAGLWVLWVCGWGLWDGVVGNGTSVITIWNIINYFHWLAFALCHFWNAVKSNADNTVNISVKHMIHVSVAWMVETVGRSWMESWSIQIEIPVSGKSGKAESLKSKWPLLIHVWNYTLRAKTVIIYYNYSSLWEIIKLICRCYRM